MITATERSKLLSEVHKQVHGIITSKLDDILEKRKSQECQASLEFEDGYEFRREGRLWSSQEESILRTELAKAIELIATMHRRTPGAIRERLKKMGIISDYSLLI